MLAGGEKSRVDTRTTAMLPGTMRDDRMTQDVRVGNISSKGMMIVSSRPPSRGHIIDISVSGHHLAGRVMWVSGRRFGVRTNERIDVAAIMGGKAPRKRRANKITVDPENAEWSPTAMLAGYGILGVTAFSTAYLIVTYLII
ncbi:PilZ domain-containing protein [Aurantiacibacter marinus]|nr:PilZ domain-containing protein [Aurantiacibacter marinus]